MVDIINSNAKRFKFRKISGFNDLNLYTDDLSITSQILQESIDNYFTDENSSSKECVFYTIFGEPDYHIHDRNAFESSLEEYWKKISSIAYKLEVENFIIPIPSMRLPTKLIESDLSYYHKFLDKLKGRLSAIADILGENSIRMLISYDPKQLFDHEVGIESLRKTKLNAPENSLDFCSPFRNFMEFRKFYDSLIATEHNIGMFLDICSYFISETNRISSKLIAEQIEEPPLENLALFEHFILKNRKTARSLFDALENIEFLKAVGFNDALWFELFTKVNIVKENITKTDSVKIFNLEMQLNRLMNERSLPGLGSIPIKSFLLMLKDMNKTGSFPRYYSFNPSLKLEGFNFDSIDWRNIDLKKVGMRPVWTDAIESYLKEKTRKFKKMYPDQDEENVLEPDFDDLKQMKVFSISEIMQSMKKFYKFM